MKVIGFIECLFSLVYAFVFWVMKCEVGCLHGKHLGDDIYVQVALAAFSAERHFCLQGCRCPKAIPICEFGGRFLENE